MAEAVIKFENASLQFPNGALALSEINTEIYEQEFAFLVGPSGAGKSSFLRLITREIVPTKGRVLINGEDLTTVSFHQLPYLRRKIGVIYQDFKLFPKKTVYENIAYVLEITGSSYWEIPAKVRKVLRTVNLEDRSHSFPEQLSGGEQQRACIARALVNNPMLLLADEPSANLDPDSCDNIFEIIERVNEEGTTVLVATHNEQIVDKLKKRVIGLAGGKTTFDRENSPYLKVHRILK